MDRRDSTEALELKAFARECAIGIPIEFGADGRNTGKFIIDRSMRTALVAGLTFELATMSFSYTAQTPWQRIFATAPLRSVRLDGVHDETRTTCQVEILLPDPDAASRFSRLGNGVVGMVRGLWSPAKNKKMNAPNEPWQSSVPMIPSEGVPALHHTSEETDEEGLPGGSFCQPDLGPDKTVCWTGFSMCDPNRPSPLSDTTNGPQRRPNGQEEFIDFKSRPQSYPSYQSGVRSANDVLYIENMFF
jgi:hypothetical protein